MADIKQAAKWLEEGSNVKRSSMPEWILFAAGWTGVIIAQRHPTDAASFEPRDLLAEDWEIAE